MGAEIDDILSNLNMARCIYHGRIITPVLKPGDEGLYLWRGPPEEPDDGFDCFFFEKIGRWFSRHFVREQKRTSVNIESIVFNNGSWDVFLSEGYRSSYDPFPVNFRNPVSLHSIQDVSSHSISLIVPGDSYLLSVIEGCHEKSFRRGPKTSEKSRLVTAKVLTAMDHSSDPFVYLANPEMTELYVAPLSLLNRFVDSSYFLSQVPTSIVAASLGNIGAVHVDVKKDEVPFSVSDNPDYSIPEIISEISSVVRGQDAAVKGISVAVYDHQVRPAGVKKSNALIIGPTGTGKTEIARTVADILSVPFAEVKLGGVSSTGFVGTNLGSVFSDLYPYRSHPHFSRSIIFLDEFDKITKQSYHDQGFGPTLQNELIGWVESAIVKVPLDQQRSYDIDTTNMLYIGAGTFVGLDEIILRRVKGIARIGFGTAISDSSLVNGDAAKRRIELYSQVIPDDLIEYGLKEELIGRFPVITFTQPLDRATLVDIIRNSKNSIFNQQILLLEQGYGVAISVDEEAYAILADAALFQGSGARALESVCYRLFEDIKVQSRHPASITITPGFAYDRLKHLLHKDYKV